MDLSSDDEGVISHRKSSSKRILDSDDEVDDSVTEKLTEATEDFKLHLSDEEDEKGDVINTKTEAHHDDLNEDSNVSSKHSNSDDSHTVTTKEFEHEEGSKDGIENSGGPKNTEISEESRGAMDIMKKLSALADSDSESDVDGDLIPLPKSSHKKSKPSSKGVLDSDSDSESCPSDSNIIGGENETAPAVRLKKEKSGPERKSKTKAKNAMLEIKAESQRQLRQSKIGLPYHVPKQRSLLDFLNRRKPSSSMPIKSSAEQLASVWKQIEEREKEAEEFYKSESEHDSESDADDNECKKVEERNEENNQTEGNEKVEVDERCKSSSSEIFSEENGVSSTDCELDTVPMLVDTCLAGDKSDETPKGENMREESMTISTLAIEESCVGNVNATEPESNLKVHSAISVSSKALDTDSAAVENLATLSGIRSVLPTMDKATLPNTQDSQDISLHLSEVQPIEGNQCSNSDINADQPDNLPDSDKSQGQNVVKSVTESKTWTELNAAMKCLNEGDSDLEDMPSEETVSTEKTFKLVPRLSLKGDPNSVIDLDDVDASPSTARTPGVKGLIERFMKHSASKKNPHKAQTVELSLISSEKDTSGGVVNVKQESLKIVLTGDDNPRSENVTPGARLKLLKSELNRQMRKQKEEEWQKKQEEMKNEQVFQGEKDDCDMLPDDEEEEEDMTESETESEPEINDVREPKRKKKTANKMFVDEEAEVEEDDDANVDADDDEDEDSSDAGEAENVDNDSDNDDSGNIGDEKSEINGNAFNERKADMSVREDQDEDTCSPKIHSLKRTMTNASSVSDLFASQPYEWRDDDDDDVIPAAQPNGVSHDKPLSQANERTMVFSPISLSIPGRGPSFMDPDPDITPTKLSWTMDAKSPSGIKTLFSEPEPSSTQEKIDEIFGLFGRKFNGGVADLANTSGTAESESDLMAMCSGKFVTQPPQPEELEGGSDQALSSVVGSQFSSQTPDAEPSQVSTLLADESVDFSLKWDEDTKKSDSLDENLKEATSKFRLEIMSSDDEDDYTVIKQKKSKNRKLEFSDDEDDSGVKNDADDFESEGSDEDTNAEVPEKENAKLFGVFSKQPKEVFYDSDENEIEPGQFLDKEAELSEEEDWHGSDDEDEKGLDQLEMNEADKEDIDQDLVREQLVKNHMQKMLDEDRRDVRILQEMLLEDGELHSENGGRERQFRWRNVDSTGMGDDDRRSDEEQAEHEDDEDDAEWRKKRHEREMFLKEQREKQKNETGVVDDIDDEVLENSELLQLGKSILFKSRSSSMDITSMKEPQQPKLTVQNQLLSPDGKKSNMLLTKRGSFLSRGDSVLAKLAKLTGSTKENVLSGAKTSGNFVFSAISPTKKESQSLGDSDLKTVKRKASMGLANSTEKKLCMSSSGRKGSGLFDHL